MTGPHGSSGLTGHITMQCLTKLPGCDDPIGCACVCHDLSEAGQPVCVETNPVLGLRCDRRPHPPGTAHYRLDGDTVRAWQAYTPPLGCRVCTAEQRGHACRWHPGVGYHSWLEPTRQQISQRMRRNRGLPLRQPPTDLPKEEHHG
ncbi:hypothetical protein AWW66_03430 [Micromonospora rosaria]|uniref:Uncharacterized protein n=1 Tax=Micromonospora rosaria TaxID=47874 RepID=A0A136PY15_9ACTN|nr:hypothetical protein [Micromonospora rosaria]KXK63378.1 hypothetical protein AWW66_03430 [Micromonospora rosaria]